jgi:hypothetical protein
MANYITLLAFILFINIIIHIEEVGEIHLVLAICFVLPLLLILAWFI